MEKQKEVQGKTKAIKLSDIAKKKEVKTTPSPEVIQNFKAREQKEAEDLRRISYEAKEEDWQKSKTAWKEANPSDTIHRHKELYIKGVIDTLPWENFEIKEEQPPMPLDQWNKMIEEAEKQAQIEKEEQAKKKTSAYIIREQDQQVKKKIQEESNQT